MAPIFNLHKITIPAVGTTPAATYYFKMRAGIYTGLGTATGVELASAAELDQPDVPIGRLLQKGILVRVKGYYEKLGKQRSANLLCTKAKVGTVLDDLKGKAYNGTTIKSAAFPVRATYY